MATNLHICTTLVISSTIISMDESRSPTCFFSLEYLSKALSRVHLYLEVESDSIRFVLNFVAMG